MSSSRHTRRRALRCARRRGGNAREPDAREGQERNDVAARGGALPARGRCSDTAGIGLGRPILHLEEDLGAFDVEITEWDETWIEAVLPPGAAVGLRYAEAMMKFVDA